MIKLIIGNRFLKCIYFRIYSLYENSKFLSCDQTLAGHSAVASSSLSKVQDSMCAPIVRSLSPGSPTTGWNVMCLYVEGIMDWWYKSRSSSTKSGLSSRMEASWWRTKGLASRYCLFKKKKINKEKGDIMTLITQNLGLCVKYKDKLLILICSVQQSAVYPILWQLEDNLL